MIMGSPHTTLTQDCFILTFTLYVNPSTPLIMTLLFFLKYLYLPLSFSLHSIKYFFNFHVNLHVTPIPCLNPSKISFNKSFACIIDHTGYYDLHLPTDYKHPVTEVWPFSHSSKCFIFLYPEVQTLLILFSFLFILCEFHIM